MSLSIPSKAIPVPGDAIRTLRPADRTRRRGVAALLAMLYLVMFSALALGFYYSFTLTAQSAYNEKKSHQARAAAESGMEFLRYHLYTLNLDHRTPADELFERVYDSLANRLNGTSNLNGGSIVRDGNVIRIPGNENDFIPLNDDGDKFRLDLYKDGKEIIVKAAGNAAGLTSGRAIRLRYGIYEKPSAIFDYGVVSRSRIEMRGNTSILGTPDPASGSVLSTASIDYPLSMGNTCEISGEVSFTNPNAWVDGGNNSMINGEVGEANWSDNIHHVDEPEFPVIDASDLISYATNVMSDPVATGLVYDNIIIPANTNPTFVAGTELNGVVYIESPNNVTFAGHAKITGVLVGDPTPTSNLSENTIDFQGTVNAYPVQNLPDDDPQFADIREMTGSFILAEGFGVDFGGNADAGDTSVSGAIVASGISFSGTADAVVEGSMINMADTAVSFSGNSKVTIRSSGTKEKPHALYFGSRYVPLPGSYEEVQP